MKKATKSQPTHDSLMASLFSDTTFMKIWNASAVPENFHRHEDVSQIRIEGPWHPCDLSLKEVETESPEDMLRIAVHSNPHSQLEIPIDADGILQLGFWCLESNLSLAEFRLDWEADTTEMGKGKCREVSDRTTLDYGSGETHFQVLSHECGDPPQQLHTWLQVSHHGPTPGTLGIGIGDDTLGELAQWFIDCRFLLEWLRRRKTADVEEAAKIMIKRRIQRKFIKRVHE
jgi:hypothetical protein